MGDISILASQEKHFIKIYENLSQYPRILHQFVKSGTKGLGGNIICEIHINNHKFILLFVLDIFVFGLPMDLPGDPHV